MIFFGKNIFFCFVPASTKGAHIYFQYTWNHINFHDNCHKTDKLIFKTIISYSRIRLNIYFLNFILNLLSYNHVRFSILLVFAYTQYFFQLHEFVEGFFFMILVSKKRIIFRLCFILFSHYKCILIFILYSNQSAQWK